MNFLIVGASSGIGLALTKMLDGDHALWLTARDTSKFSGIGLSGNNHLLAWHAGKDIGTLPLPEVLHGVVYCPGSITLKPFNRITKQDFINDVEVNAYGALQVVQAAAPALKKAGNASVVLFSTVAVQTGMPFHSSVAAAKGAVEGLTRALAAELAPVIRVNAIAPSLTDTPLAEKLLQTPEKREAAAKRHPLQKVGSPQELAALARFLLMPEAGWITGQILHADGGMSALKLM